jgi:Ser/Thr protein kinase RdoA (MazF antagonist)
LSQKDSTLVSQLASRYRLRDVELRRLGTPVNDVVAVTAAEGQFALKLYHRYRTPQAVQWEIDLLLHLAGAGAPVVRPVRGTDGYLEHLIVGANRRGWLCTIVETPPGSLSLTSDCGRVGPCPGKGLRSRRSPRCRCVHRAVRPQRH